MQKQEIIVLRVMAMLMVVAFHSYCAYAFCLADPEHWSFGVNFVQSYQHLAKFLHTIDMPAFTFISGFLYAYLKLRCGKYADTVPFVMKKSKRLLLPYCVWFVVLFLIRPGRFQLLDFFKGVDHLWYLLMLAWCFAIVEFSQFVWRKASVWVNVALCLAFFVSYYVFLHFDLLTDYLCFNSMLAFFPFFFMGVLIVNHGVDDYVENHFSPVVLGLIVGCMLVALFFLTDETFRFHSDLLSRFCGFFISVLLMFLFKQVPAFCVLAENNIVRSLDKNSMGIYLLHLIFIVVVLDHHWFVKPMNDYWMIAPLILFLTAFSFSWLLSWLINKTKLSVVFG